jgi:DNA topoisomerase-1
VYNKVPYFEFLTNLFGEVILIPLKGHISDVAFPQKYARWLGTDIKTLVTNPEIQYIMKERDISALLKKYAKEANKVIIATDADREGESIGKEAVGYLQDGNKTIEIKRAYFSAITKDELGKAFSKLNELNYNIADAADARREIDLIWGAVLTRYLSIIIKRLGPDFLSAGRVQSPTLAKIVEKDLEIEAFKPEKYWQVELTLKKGEEFLALYEKEKIESNELAEKIFNTVKETVKVKDLDKKKRKIPKPTPFNTTDFLREATKLGFSAEKAIGIAENLYMNGYISYPRTDNRKYVGVEIFKILADLEPGFKKEVEKLKKQNKIIPSAGEETKDHPPIHPVSLAEESKLAKHDWKIYKLVVDRFFATLAEDAEANATKATFSTPEYLFISEGLEILKSGWLEFYPYRKVVETSLPALELNEDIPVIDKQILAKETKPPARFSQGTLLKLMEDLNLGTKSTRPTIIEKLFTRNYIDGSKQLISTEIARAVVSALNDYAKEIVLPETTAKLEEEMTSIENKERTKEQVVTDSRELLLKIVAELLENKALIAKRLMEGINKHDSFGACFCGGTLRKMNSKAGKIFVGCSNYPNCKITYSLPQKDIFTYKGKCEICKAPQIEMKKGRRKYEFCLNSNCPSKKDFAKKKEEAQKKIEKPKKAKKVKKE